MLSADAVCTTGSRCYLDSDAPTLPHGVDVNASTEHRVNIAHLVLRSIWNDELSSGKREPKRTNTEHDWRGRQDQHKRQSASRCCEDSPRDDPSCLCGSCENPPPRLHQPFSCAYRGRGRPYLTAVQICLPRPRQSLLNPRH